MNLAFENEKRQNIKKIGSNENLHSISRQWITEVSKFKYSYNFTWLGRPIIQFPQDIIAMQEIIWQIKPELIIETGVAHGGSLIFYASMLELIGKNGFVIGVDIEIRKHNRTEIEAHPLYNRIHLVEGDSTKSSVVEKIYKLAEGKAPILVVLDSNHTHKHVLKEMTLYSKLVTKNSYLVVFDTIIEDMPKGFFKDRPWEIGNNPKTAVSEFLKKNNRFVLEQDIENKLLITVAPGGYLKCVKEK
jgi:cephalosporin hydroxylase